jgi:signal transduction histidine kinase
MHMQVDQSDRTLADLAPLEQLQQLFQSESATSLNSHMVRERALQRARIAFECGDGNEEDRRVELRILAVELLSGVRLELAAHPAAARRLVARIEDHTGLHHAVLARELLNGPDLLSLPPAVGIAAQLSLLTVFAPLHGASLWSQDANGQVLCISQEGEPSDDVQVAEFAQSLLTNGKAHAGVQQIVGVRVERWGRPVAAVVGRTEPVDGARCRALLAEAVPMLAAILERDDLLTRSAEIERVLRSSGERRLTRLGLDVHDGPLQDLAALAQDLRLFRQQLGLTLAGHERESLLSGRIDDLDAQLVAVDADLRRLSSSLQSPFLLHRDFGRALHETAESFRTRTGIKPRLELTGDLSTISESQQMALLAITREALGNVREHSDASEVRISVAADAGGVRAELSDNGRGFDVESTLLVAGRGGHLGLVGMQERVRLLDGHSRIDSRPGGPTTITISLPRWEPVGPS